MKTLEELAKEQIIRSYNNGLDELHIETINYERERNGIPLITPTLYLETDRSNGGYIINPAFDIVKFVDSLSPEEILEVIDSQACLAYR